MKPLHRMRERASLARLTIGLVKIIHHGKVARATRDIGGQVELLLISGAVLIGHAEGKPKTSSDIARFLGIPRATVQRKLAELVSIGMVERHGGPYLIADGARPSDYSYIDEAVRLILHTAKALDR